MIWVETGASTRIVKANMDGTTMKEVINDDIDTPTDIVIDHSVDDGIIFKFYNNLNAILKYVNQHGFRSKIVRGQ